LVASLVPAAGIRVAVQVRPPSLEARLESVPLATLTSAAVKPVTASVKVKVTVALPPMASTVSEIAMLEARLGRTVSTAKLPLWAVPLPALPARSAMPP